MNIRLTKAKLNSCPKCSNVHIARCSAHDGAFFMLCPDCGTQSRAAPSLDRAVLSWNASNTINLAEGEFGKWNRAGEKALAGLARRREVERRLFATPAIT